MKGQIFNVFEKLVTEKWSEALLEELYVDANIPEERLPFVGPLTYPDEWLIALVVALSKRTEIPVPDLVRAFGRYAFPHLAKRFPGFVESAPDACTFLRSVDGVIHVEVKKLDREAILPRVVIEDRDGHIVLRYHSDRKLCSLVEGLLDGVSDWYGEPIGQSHVACMHRGAPECEIELAFGA